MQHEVTKYQKLLDGDGHIYEPGWAKTPVWTYSRKDIKRPALLTKEWDYYLITNDEVGMAFTISDLGYIGMASVSLLDFKKNQHQTKTEVSLFPMGRMHMGQSSDNVDAEMKHDRLHIKYRKFKNYRIIQCHCKNFKGEDDLNAEIWVKQERTESMCIATPWVENPKAFYYNQKINCMPASGCIRLGNQQWRMKPDQTMAVLDWGRGTWTYDNQWYWGTGSGRIDGVPFGFNIGYGFSDRSSASENLLFYDHKVHKLEQVVMSIPQTADGEVLYTEPWQIDSSDERFTGVFIPAFDRAACMDYKLICSDQHQVFGYFTGKAVLDDGKVLNIRHFLCAVEIVHNKY